VFVGLVAGLAVGLVVGLAVVLVVRLAVVLVVVLVVGLVVVPGLPGRQAAVEFEPAIITKQN
jgi:hypothetical protein